MSILSIDIGIHNLSLCILSCINKTDFKTYTIHVWENKNIGTDMSLYTKKQTSDTNTIINTATISKQQNITQHVIQHVTLFYNTYKNLIHKSVSHIYIEKQPKINMPMFMISVTVYTTLIQLIHQTEINNNNMPVSITDTSYIPKKINIDFIDARKKLQVSSYYKGPDINTLQYDTHNTSTIFTKKCKKTKNNTILLKGKNAYTNRKKLSIYYCTYFLSLFCEHEKEKWIPFFEKTKKKDDLSDTFLYCIHILHQ
jgi:hypothetical protein